MVQKITQAELPDDTDLVVNRIAEHGIGGIIGGFPCQDVSWAGEAAGIQRDAAGYAVTRSGLFWEMVKTYLLVRPKFWLMENVAGLLHRGMGEVLGAVASCGSDAEWDCVGASTVGAPHHRPRIYILAYDCGGGGEGYFPQEIPKQREFSWLADVRGFEDLPDRSDLYPSKLCRGHDGLAKRLHGIGNGNPPCVIRELTRGLR